MKLLFIPTMLALVLCSASALAEPLPDGGITREEMLGLLTKSNLPGKIDKDDHGKVIIKSRTNGVNFDVYFYNCEGERCRDIQFAAGWTDAAPSQDRVNAWNTQKRFIRAYWKPGKVLFAEQDARIARSTTENIDAAIVLWSQMIGEFKAFMKL